jgi:hypothetical protein
MTPYISEDVNEEKIKQFCEKLSLKYKLLTLIRPPVVKGKNDL